MMMNALSAFQFGVRFVGQGPDIDASFQELAGIGPEMQTEPYHEGGEARFPHQLPKAVKHPRLTLKRGVALIDSKLVAWCRETLEGGLGVAIKPAGLEVTLLDGSGNPLRQWTLTDAYPVRLQIEPFASIKAEWVIEQIEIAYAVAQRKA